MTELSVDELKSIQLDILQALHDYCCLNGINYSLNYGTLIGAIRHKGYIPWDDDIDVCMLRPDYQKLEQDFPQIYKGRYRFLTLNRDSKWNRPYAMMYDSNTLEIEEISNGYEGIGIGIDIFPIDDFVADEKHFRFFHILRRFLIRIYTLKGIKLSKSRSILKNLFLLVVGGVLSPFSTRRLAKMIDKFIKRNDSQSAEYVFSATDAIGTKKHVPKQCFKSYIEVPFEDRKFYVMEGYDFYLRNIYGDYMELPPIEDRVSHHVFKAWRKD